MNTINPTAPGIRTTEFWTTILSQLFGLLLAAGIITQSQASSANSAVPQVGGLLAFIVPTVLYIATRFGLKWRFGPMPQLPTPATASTFAPASNGPVAPTYQPPSTGSGYIPTVPADLPTEAV